MFKRKVPSGPIEKGRLEEDKGSQAASRAEKPSAEHSIIPADLTISGDLVSSGDVHVEGIIHGNIRCRTLTLTGEPVIKGSVEVETVRVCGIFDGHIQAKKVTLTRAANVTGEIYYETLEIEPGALFEGKVSRMEGA
jgi:cytoskeletal protein CcmA (bactofilin family)